MRRAAEIEIDHAEIVLQQRILGREIGGVFQLRRGPAAPLPQLDSNRP